jgi:hypothetical protein
LAKETVFKRMNYVLEYMNKIKQYLYIGKVYSIMNSKHNQGQVMKREIPYFFGRIEKANPYGFIHTDFFCLDFKEFVKG